MCCANLRNVIWKLFEDPNSSKAAKVRNRKGLCIKNWWIYCHWWQPQCRCRFLKSLPLMGLVSEPLPPQGVGDRELPLPPRLHHHAHPLNGARVSSGWSLSHNKVASPETNKGQGSEWVCSDMCSCKYFFCLCTFATSSARSSITAHHIVKSSCRCL